jgi:hypothetical protein
VHAWLFTRDIFDEVLAQKGCAGVRCYRAITPEGEPQLVLVGVDRKGDDIVPTGRPRRRGTMKGGTARAAAPAPGASAALMSAGKEVVVGDVGWPCPPVCSKSSPLNS